MLGSEFQLQYKINLHKNIVDQIGSSEINKYSIAKKLLSLNSAISLIFWKVIKNIKHFYYQVL